jgi:Transposase DDE domain
LASSLPPPPPPADPQRRARGFLLAQDTTRRIERVERTTPDGKAMVLFRVPSARLPEVFYDVYALDNGRWICGGCPDFAARFEPCKHIYEVLDRFYPDSALPPPDERLLTAWNAGGGHYRGAYRQPPLPFVYDSGPAESTRKDHALEEEDVRLPELLADLASVLDEQLRVVRRGHPSLSPGQRVLAMVMRVQHEKSMRKFRPTGRELEAAGLLRFGPSKSTLVRYNGSLDTLAYVARAYEAVVEPFTDLERILIADATGFSSRLVANWLDHSTAEAERRAVTDYRDETVWLKLHALVGRHSHAILGFRLTPPRGPMSADATLLPYLLEDAVAAGFAPQYVPCDNIYLTAANWGEARRHGAWLVCPEKGRNRSRKTGEPIGVAKEMARLRAAFPELVEELKRARQAIEGVFSVEKRADNHLGAVGTKDERRAFRNALAGHPGIAGVVSDVEHGLFVSRLVEIYVRMIRQVLRRTVAMEHLWGVRISYQRKTKFPLVRR